MSIKVSRNSANEEPMIKWADDVGIEIENDSESITSEEEIGSEYDGEQSNRNKHVQEIWNENYIWNQLLTLPDAEEIIELIKQDDYKELLTKNNQTILLVSTWLGKEHVLKTFLDRNVEFPQIFDNAGRSLLHLAAYSGNIECLKILLTNKGNNINIWDSTKSVTPLHCAASKGNLPCLRLLLRYGADVNAGLVTKSPLHYAVQSLAVDCVKELLENDAIPNTPQVFSETPLHVAASLGSSEIIKLLIKHGAAVNIQCGSDKLTPLHLAAEDGDSECARILIEAGAQVSSKNYKKQTPLHLAALSQCAEIVEFLLNKGADPNSGDSDGRTPLHSAIVKVTRSCECVKLLLNAGAKVNLPDSFGYTALHLAALNEFSNCVMLLLSYGGDVTARTNGGISVLNFITRKTPDVIPKYIKKFDQSIKLNDHEIGDVDCELKLDFRILVPTMGNKETELLLNFIEVGHREVLKHPLCETFLFLKWRRIRKFFLFSLFYHSLFVLLFTFYVIGVFLKDCPSKGRLIIQICIMPIYAKIFGYLLLCLNFMLLGKEMFQIAHSWFAYIKQWENWLQWMIIISVFCCVHPTTTINIRMNVHDWQHHIAAIGIFLSWVELMMIVGRFPIFGLYIQMFTTVSINFAKFLLAYFCLLLAFALSFGILFANYPSFKDLKWVVLKVIVMMSGELEFEDIFYDDDYPIIYNWTAHIMFLCYVLLVTVILTNLMVGLAVSDIQGLQKSAGLDRIVRQAELVAHLESMLFSRLLTCIPHKLMNFFHKQALLLKSQYHWALYIKPNDPREERIPKDLIRSIYQLVAERKEKPKNRRKFNNKNIRSLSRLNSDSSNYYFNNNDKTESLKMQIDEINKEFYEFCKKFKQKMDAINNEFHDQR